MFFLFFFSISNDCQSYVLWVLPYDLFSSYISSSSKRTYVGGWGVNVKTIKKRMGGGRSGVVREELLVWFSICNVLYTRTILDSISDMFSSNGSNPQIDLQKKKIAAWKNGCWCDAKWTTLSDLFCKGNWNHTSPFFRLCRPSWLVEWTSNISEACLNKTSPVKESSSFVCMTNPCFLKLSMYYHPFFGGALSIGKLDI